MIRFFGSTSRSCSLKLTKAEAKERLRQKLSEMPELEEGRSYHNGLFIHSTRKLPGDFLNRPQYRARVFITEQKESAKLEFKVQSFLYMELAATAGFLLFLVLLIFNSQRDDLLYTFELYVIYSAGLFPIAWLIYNYFNKKRGLNRIENLMESLENE